jgi:hypothetical protein|tara:strand:- start:531 stop:1082 length:552 start_codon:yes stop_codon:yes gene_type:complete
MANQKLTDKTSLGGNTGNTDVFMVVDTSDTTGSAQGTSKKVKTQYVIQTDKLSLSNANIIALDDGGGAGEFQTLIAAPGSGKGIIPLSVTAICTYASATETSNKSFLIGYQNDQTTRYWTKISRIMASIGSGVNTYIQATPIASGTGASSASITNLPLYLWSDGTFNGGWTADVYVTYQIITL